MCCVLLCVGHTSGRKKKQVKEMNNTNAHRGKRYPQSSNCFCSRIILLLLLFLFSSVVNNKWTTQRSECLQSKCLSSILDKVSLNKVMFSQVDDRLTSARSKKKKDSHGFSVGYDAIKKLKFHAGSVSLWIHENNSLTRL